MCFSRKCYLQCKKEGLLEQSRCWRQINDSEIKEFLVVDWIYLAQDREEMYVLTYSNKLQVWIKERISWQIIHYQFLQGSFSTEFVNALKGIHSTAYRLRTWHIRRSCFTTKKLRIFICLYDKIFINPTPFICCRKCSIMSIHYGNIIIKKKVLINVIRNRESLVCVPRVTSEILLQCV